MGKRKKIEPAKPAKPSHVVVTHGILTFDSRYCCGHEWRWLTRDDPRRQEFHRVCSACGAGSTLGEVNGRQQIVEYDRDWHGGRADEREIRLDREEEQAATGR